MDGVRVLEGGEGDGGLVVCMGACSEIYWGCRREVSAYGEDHDWCLKNGAMNPCICSPSLPCFNFHSFKDCGLLVVLSKAQRA